MASQNITYGVPSRALPMPNKYHRLVHLDLKGAPPKMDYLLKVLPLFKEWGATGLLVEYEDTFPYSGELEVLQKGEEVYSLADVATLQQTARNLGLEYIPLIQTFGHLEFVLKHSQFSHLREDPEDRRSLCPSNPESIVLVRSMIDQVMTQHPNLKYFHIGADEVWMKKRCARCCERIRDSFHGEPVGLFVSHAKAVLLYLKETYPHVRAIMWDDMLRNAKYDFIKDSNLHELVDIMVWNYLDTSENFHRNTPETVWQLYGKVFENVWIASAFKGAFGPSLFLTPELEHIRNQELWAGDLSRTIPKHLDFKGIVFTGWQRYTHETVLCELLPVGLPSLAFCLQTFMQGHFSEELHQSISQRLGFPGLLGLEIETNLPLSEMPVGVPMGTFPGCEMYMCARQLATIQSSREGQKFFKLTSAFVDKEEEALSSEKPGSSLAPLSEDETGPVLSLLSKLTALKSTAERALGEVYQPSTSKEWLDLCVVPLLKRLERRLAATKALDQ
ncbi:hexosaminidase D-like [Strongylocentrotus purpuratus]|uniref:beta-N-acetylhexosaminidase n=1 Tax=Strongylocentrotus purpuratus TaxID=7668 RepID=A0A7M7NR20_STRPU|nr:hexosaminidase D-like [Strongylocentrotus purpuratus]